ncbi:MAG: cyclic nucleotide-binding domain-containing protein, partial [Magnetococcales bacterium]|nr:cyclic nucleotide-binding domain-containing protein [Magnetococcales bacterium]
ELAERAREMGLEMARQQIGHEVLAAMCKRTQDGVNLLALELGIKEVLSSLYGGGGNETSMHVSPAVISLLSGVCSELSGWVQADTSRAMAVGILRQAIVEGASALAVEGIEAKLLAVLPELPAADPSANADLWSELVVEAKRLLQGTAYVKEGKALAKELATASDVVKPQLEEKISRFAKSLGEKALERGLVRLGVRGHLREVERTRRKALNLELSGEGQKDVADAELDALLKRYESYADFMEESFDKRVQGSLSSTIRDFQLGANDETDQRVSTKGFLTYLIALRTSGGKLDAKNESVPVVSSLQAIPDAVPDIHVQLPDPGASRGMVLVKHNEGILLEKEFELAARDSSVPEGIPGGLWFAFRDFAERMLEYHLSGDSIRKKDRELHGRIVAAYTVAILTKVMNLFRSFQKLPASEEFTDLVELLAKSVVAVGAKAGEAPGDERLDLVRRPPHVSAPAVDARQELRGVIVSFQKSGDLGKDDYRFKSGMKSFAGAGGRPGQKLLLPTEITCQNGLVSIRAVFQETPFEKKVRVAGSEPEVTEPAAGSPAQTGAVPQAQASVPGAAVAAKKVPGPPTAPQSHAAAAPRPVVDEARREKIFQLVGSLGPFRQFTDYEKRKICELDVSFKQFPANGTIIEEGTHDTAFYILVKGRVDVVKSGVFLVTLGPGEIIGEMAFLTNTARSTSVVAKENAVVLRVDQEMLSRLGPESREKIKDQIVVKLVERLAESTDLMRARMVDGSVDSPMTRIGGIDSENALLKDETPDLDSTLKLIENLSFFEKFSPYEMRRVMAFNASFQTYRGNGEIFREGSKETAFYIVLSGSVGIVKGDAEIVELGAGEFFGEMAFLTNTPRTTTVITKGEVLALRVDQQLLKRLGPEIREKIKDRFIEKMIQRLAKTTKRIGKG